MCFYKEALSKIVIDRKRLNCAEFGSVEAAARREDRKRSGSLSALLCSIRSVITHRTDRTHGEEKEDVTYCRKA